MAKKVYLSFHYERDNWRVNQVAQIGAIEEQEILDEQAWEEVKKKGDAEIKKWIADKMFPKNCLVCLIGKETANRQWVQYEIEKAWNDNKGVVGIYIHGLKNSAQEQDTKGPNPFSKVSVKINGVSTSLSGIVTAYDPPYSLSTNVFDDIKTKIEGLIDDAIALRKTY
jgi:hypothetical protein